MIISKTVLNICYRGIAVKQSFYYMFQPQIFILKYIVTEPIVSAPGMWTACCINVYIIITNACRSIVLVSQVIEQF